MNTLQAKFYRDLVADFTGKLGVTVEQFGETSGLESSQLRAFAS
jgi:hypothetical protein